MTEETAPEMVEAVEAVESVEEPKKLTAEQWAAIRDRYERGGVKAADLAREYGISTSAISQHFKKYKVVAGGRAKAEAEAEVAATAAAAPPAPAKLTFADKRLAREEQTREEGYNLIRMARMKQARALAEAEKTGTPIAAMKEAVRVYRMQIASIAEAVRFELEILQSDKFIKEDELPNIEIRDLSDEEAEALASGPTEEDDEVVVTE